MLKFAAIILLTLTATIARSQNIVTALYLNENKDYKTAQPKKVEEITTTYTEDSKRTERKVKTFDSVGMPLTEERYNRNDDLIARLVYTNDPVKKLVLKRFYEEVGKYATAKETNTYTYDSDNALVNVLSQDENDKITQRCDIVNDQKGHPVELNLYNQFGIASGKETATYFYDRNTVIITKLATDGSSLTDTTKITLKNAHSFAEKDETYNPKGDLIKWSGKNADGAKTSFEEEYKYDKAGNCISDILYSITTSAYGDKEKKLEREIRRKYTY